MDLSIVIPLFNEEDNIQLLYEAVSNALTDFAGEYELLFVDDGSTDTTFELAKTICTDDGRVKVIKFRHNYGQTPAMAAGIDLASGDVIVTMDGDLQNDPTDIPMFMEKMSEGYDIVVGWRYRRQDRLVTRKIPSWIANWIIGQVTGVPIKDNGCSLKAYRASVIKAVPLYSDMHRFIPAMASIAGARVAEVKVQHHARRFGESKYGLSRIYKVLIDLITVKTLISFSSKPLYWFTILASPFLLIGTLAAITAVFSSATWSSAVWISIAGTGLLFLALAMFLFGAGLLSELVYRFGDLALEKYYKFTISRFNPTSKTKI